MQNIKEAAAEFLTNRRVAVTPGSRGTEIAAMGATPSTGGFGLADTRSLP